jgi:hypothetical protein
MMNLFGGNALNAGGITGDDPLFGIDTKVTQQAFLGLSQRFGMLAKIGKQYFVQPKGLLGDLGRVFSTGNMSYGGAVENVYVKDGEPIRAGDGSFWSANEHTMIGELGAVNYRTLLPFAVNQRDPRKYLLAEQYGSWEAQQLDAPRKTMMRALYTAYKEIVSNCISGTRTWTSTTSSNGQGTGVTTPVTNVNPYVDPSNVRSMSIVMPELGSSKPSFSSISDLLDVVRELTDLKSVLSQADVTTNTALGVADFLSERPNIIMEHRVLDAGDDILRRSSGTMIGPVPTTTFRSMLREVGDLVEIDSFASLPTTPSGGTDYSASRLLSVMADKRTFYDEITIPEELRSIQLVNLLKQSYAYHEERVIYARGGVPAGCVLTKKASA